MPLSSAATSRRNTFATASLDRVAEHRDDAAWIAARRGSRHARFLGLDAETAVPTRDGHLVALESSAVADGAPASLLGLRDGEPWFLLHDPIAHTDFPDAAWLGLRAAGLHLAAEDAGVLVYACGLANWQRVTRHCPACGGALTLVSAGHRAVCSQCGLLHFPRTDSAIIVLVEHEGACLLGRQATWRAGQYSTLAGFVEPGETLEGAVCREVREEAGIEVIDCDYHSSQPWPFPASLMLAFTATASSRDIRLIDGELAEARWFTPDEYADGIRAGSLCTSSPLSISYRLIEHWLRTRAGLELDALPRGE